MKNLMSFFGAAAFIIAAALFASAYTSEGSPGEDEIGITLSTAKQIYSVGEAVHLRLTLFNRSNETWVLSFNTSQRYDFIARTAGEGKEVWRWSGGRMFMQVLGEESLRSGDALSYREKITSGLEEGHYIITGEITSSPNPLSASISVEVR